MKEIRIKTKDENVIFKFGRYQKAICTCGHHFDLDEKEDVMSCPNCHTTTMAYNYYFHNYENTFNLILYNVTEKKERSFKIQEIRKRINCSYDGFQLSNIKSKEEERVEISYDFFAKEKLQVKSNKKTSLTKAQKYSYLSNFGVSDISDGTGLFAFTNKIASTGAVRKTIMTLEEYPEIEILYSTYGNHPFFYAIRVEHIHKGKKKPNQILGISKSLLNHMLNYIEPYERRLGEVFSIYEKYKEKPDLAEIYIKDICENKLRADNYFDMLNTYKYNREKLMKYLRDDIYTFQGIDSPKEGLNILIDYVEMCVKMNIPYDKYPESLKKAHDVAVKNYKMQESEIINRKFKEVIEKEDYKELNDTISDYVVKTPEKVEDVKSEGRILHHCVASYIERIADGKTKIIFMRHKQTPEISLLTLEVQGDKLMQYKGLYNRNPSAKEMEAIRSYAKKKHLTVA